MLKFITFLCTAGLSFGEAKLALPEPIFDFFDSHCTKCHDDSEQKGEIRLDQFEKLSGTQRVNLLGQIEEQLYLEAMPPKKRALIQPAEFQEVFTWIDREYRNLKATSVFKQKLKKPKYGNYISHQKLFSGEIQDAPWSPARRWLISPYIYNEKIKELFGMTEKEIFSQQLRRSILNPFNLSDREAVHYYDGEVLNEGHLSTIIANAQWIADKQIEEILIETGETTARKRHNGGNSYVNEWHPPTTAILKEIITSPDFPSDQLLKSAITEQFQKVLNRIPSSSELTDYLAFSKSNIKSGGRSKGIRNMLVAVFLEEEIYYRSEFGGGKSDQHGRKMLTPQEAAVTISYALTDARPDAELLKAANEGRLKSKEDFKREVLRLLADTSKEYPVDRELWHGRYDISNPRILRFFRDFFGYPKSTKLFKDQNRYWGKDYRRVPENLTKEADQLIEHWINLDQTVIENILSSDKFYVFHDGDNEKTRQKVEGLAKGFESHLKRLEGHDWKKDPEEAFIASGLIKADRPDGKGRRSNSYHFKKMLIRIEAADQSVARGFRPIPFTRYDMRIRQTHIYAYNLDPNNWDYEHTQPFSLPNRRGILSHPAWLIAHSKNTENDPVHRGLWIRKHLLADYVPDVPITVDAVIPEHKNLTLRSRLDMVTKDKSCWRCHVKMNPLGNSFEHFDDFGIFRTLEPLEHEENIIKKGTLKPNVPNTYKTLPVDSNGHLTGTGDPKIDGPVTGGADLMARLGPSTIARQSVIRHAFRYFMGRNEMLSDSKTLIAADKAYQQSGGSFKAVIVSLLASDSFIYRK